MSARRLLLAAFWLWPSAATAGPLDYEPSAFSAERVPVSTSPALREFEVRFPSPLTSRFPADNTVWAHLLLPQAPAGGRRPCILVLPVMAAPNIWIEQRFIRAFCRAGFAVLWLEMPFQFHRRPQPGVPSGQVFLSRTAPGLARNFRQACLDARRALDWLRAQPEIDPGRIGLFGISLGGMVAASVYSVDPTPRYAVLLLAGADFPSLVLDGAMTRRFARRAGLSAGELRRAWSGLDPLEHRLANEGKPVLLVNARWDAVVPRANARKLREAFPSSRQVWVPFGHYSSIVHLLWMPRWVAGACRGLSRR